MGQLARVPGATVVVEIVALVGIGRCTAPASRRDMGYLVEQEAVETRAAILGEEWEEFGMRSLVCCI